MIISSNLTKTLVQLPDLATGHDALVPLVDYALRLDGGEVIRRLCFLLEHYGLADASVLESLSAKLTATLSVARSLLPAEGAG